jgi:hypothetical protein
VNPNFRGPMAAIPAVQKAGSRRRHRHWSHKHRK